MTDLRARFDALLAAARDRRDAAAGLELAGMLTRMRARPHPEIDQAWELALATPWDRPDVLAPAALRYVAQHPLVECALTDPADDDALRAALEHLARSRIFQRVAQGALITSKEWLGLLLRARALAFKRWFADGSTLPCIEWIAIQANLAEYVWPPGIAAADLERLRARLAGGIAAPHEAVLLACFEHPGDHGESALNEADSAQDLLLHRLYREPAAEAAIATSLAVRARDALPQAAQRAQYESYPYPRWIAEPLLPVAIPEPVSARMKKPWLRKQQLLIAGCGTGLQCMAASATHPDAAITAIDFSVASMAYAVRKCREAGIANITFEPADLLACARRGSRFDIVECIGVLHHLSDLDAGAAALRALVRPGGLLRLAVYSAAARQGVHALRTMIAHRGLGSSIESLRQVRQEVLAGEHGAMSPSMLLSPDLHSASGLHDLLFNACEHTMGAVAWADLMARHGFTLVCMDPPAPTLAAAGPASPQWGPREWEDYERSRPDAFASMYEFWFVAGG